MQQQFSSFYLSFSKTVHVVGREWRWQMDPPDVIVHEAIASHVKMIKSFSGAPGVKALRLQEGYQASA